MLQTQEIELAVPLNLAPGVVAHNLHQLADAIISASEEQCENKTIDDDDERVDFVLACDAFNLWKMRRRLEEEISDGSAINGLVDRLGTIVCEKRGHDADEFSLALEATDERVRFPFGLDPLQYAQLLSSKNPIRVLHREVQDPLSKQILGIAIQLKKLNGHRPVLLPIEQLRTLLRCRKLVAGGAVKRLIRSNLLSEIGEKAHTGRAREFRVLATEGVDFEYEKADRPEPSPHL